MKYLRDGSQDPLQFHNVDVDLIPYRHFRNSELKCSDGIYNSNMNSFFRFVNKRASYPFCFISLAHAPVNVT